MSYDFWSEKEVTARKAWTCDEASEAIAVGDRYSYGAGKWDGSDMVEQRLCLTCRVLIDETWRAGFWDGDDGFPLTEVRKMLREEHGIVDADAWAASARLMRQVSEKIEAIRILDEATTGAVLREIAEERRRQVGQCGWSPDHDDSHAAGELARAAAAYAAPPGGEGSRWLDLYARDIWPWHTDGFRRKDRRVDLVRAGALIVAELERLDRVAAAEADA